MQIPLLLLVVIGCRAECIPPPRCPLGRRAALIGRGACPSAPAPSGCRRGGGRSMRRVTLFVNGSARNGKVRPERGRCRSPGPCPALPQPPGAAAPCWGQRGAPSLPAGAVATGGDLPRLEALRWLEGAASGCSCGARLWDEGSKGRREPWE